MFIDFQTDISGRGFSRHNRVATLLVSFKKFKHRKMSLSQSFAGY